MLTQDPQPRNIEGSSTLENLQVGKGASVPDALAQA
jgi:hypothetical protein